MKQREKAIAGGPVFRCVRAAAVSVTPHVVEIFGEGADGKAVIVKFSPYQGVKFTTIDCFRASYNGWTGEVDQITEVPNSPWLEELRRTLKQKDSTANFLDRSKHFILPAEDVVIEIIAWEWGVMNVPKGTGRTARRRGRS